MTALPCDGGNQVTIKSRLTWDKRRLGIGSGRNIWETRAMVVNSVKLNRTKNDAQQGETMVDEGTMILVGVEALREDGSTTPLSQASTSTIN